MPMQRAFRFPLVAGAVLLCAISGCDGPTYPKATVASSLEQIMREDGLDTSVRFLDHTLGVQLSYPGSISQTDAQITLGPEFQEAARKVLTAIHRVALSTDADIRFYVLLLSDPASPGAYLTMVRYLDDIKRANANMIDSPEMFARTIFELSYTGGTPVTIAQYVPRDIELEDFLSWQLARRIQYALTDEVQPTGTVNVGRCGGRFQDGEFAFTLDVAPLVPGAALDDATMEKIFKVSSGVIAQVLENYRFEQYDAVRLIHPMTGRSILLPKTKLEVFR
jgi:hypothetical protein